LSYIEGKRSAISFEKYVSLFIFKGFTESGLTNYVLKGPQSRADTPKQETIKPVTKPFLFGNHSQPTIMH